jgi:hypothetical protein
MMRSPDAARHEVLRRRSGVLPNSEFAKVPGLQRTAAALRRARDKRPPYAMLRTIAKPANSPAIDSTTDKST